MKRIEVLDHGYVELVDKMGDDYRILEAARISTGADARKGDEKDRKLIRYLYTQGHSSPLEQCLYTFRIKAPLFVVQQMIRHRTARINQASARYQEFEWLTYYPEKWRTQNTTNKQSSNEITDDMENIRWGFRLERADEASAEFYYRAVEGGVAKELARIAMPMGQYTELFWNIDLHNLFHFIQVRDHPHAQYEIQVYAQAMLSLLKEHGNIPWALEIFEQVRSVQYALQEKLRGLEDFEGLTNYIKAFGETNGSN